MYVSSQTIITAGGILTTIIAFVTLGWKLFKWINHQKEQDQEIARIEEKFDKEISDVKNMHIKDQASIQEEQTLVVYGMLACLKGLQEKGCNGPVSEAINKLEKHINKKAHGQE